MKTALISLALFVAMPIMAQNSNAQQNVSVCDLSYMIKEQPKSELGTVVGAVLDVLADQTTEEQPGYVDAVRASVIMALGNVRRFTVSDGLQVAPTKPQTSLLMAQSTTSLQLVNSARSRARKTRSRSSTPRLV